MTDEAYFGSGREAGTVSHRFFFFCFWSLCETNSHFSFFSPQLLGLELELGPFQCILQIDLLLFPRITRVHRPNSGPLEVGKTELLNTN